jgi:hypothetical protein
MSVDVVWSATNEDDEDFARPEIKRNLYLAPPWADCESNGEAVAQDLAEDWLRPHVWVQLIGDDDWDANVLIRIHAPPSIAGTYRVECERVIKACASKLPPASEGEENAA